jgi:dUTP pyrophosphatase
MLTISLQRLAGHDDLPLPAYATAGAAGMDLYAAVRDALTLAPGAAQLVPCGVSLALPDGFEAQIRPRSGLAAQAGVTVLNAPGTIDSDYRGEIKVLLINHGPSAFTVKRGMRVAQLVVAPVVRVAWNEVSELPPTARGAGGYGHTGL